MKKYLLIILCVAGCAYYNILYNAKEYYEKAMQSTPPNKEFLDKSIEKCEKIIKYHPKCKYVPDAIFLMGKCFLEKGEYDRAIRKFQELITYYPHHNLAYKSQLELCKAYLRNGDYIEARRALEGVKEDKEEAITLTMDSYFLSKDYENSIRIGEEFIEQFPKSKLKVEVLTKLANSYDSLKRFEPAIKYYEEALKVSARKFDLSLSIVNLLIEIGKYEEALKRLTALRELAKAQEKTNIELAIARCYKEKGEFDEALKTLGPLENSPEALYEMGIIYEEELSDLEKAREHYEKARKTGGSSEIAQKALLRASRIGKLTEYREKIQDTTKVEDLAKTQFLLAELYWLEFNRVDEAIQEYEKLIQDFPKSEFAAKSAYSIAWLLENEKKDKEKAILAYERVERDFPDTEYANLSRKRTLELKSSTANESNKK